METWGRPHEMEADGSDAVISQGILTRKLGRGKES
jgi:hypothetical protein